MNEIQTPPTPQIPEWAVDFGGYTPAEVCLIVTCRNAGYPYYKFKDMWDKSQRSIIGKKAVGEDFYYSLCLQGASPKVSMVSWVDFTRFLERNC